MKFNIQWLREWVNPPLTTEELVNKLTMAGLEVEVVEPQQSNFSGVIVARLNDITNHPTAAKLKICTLQMGDEVHNVISGAPNLHIGACYALALPGARLLNGRLIQQTAIKGNVSQGMLCSAAELGLNGEANSLLELDKSAPLGVMLEEYLGLPDEIIDLALTPNRGDCLGIRGIAREVGVLTKTKVESPSIPIITPSIGGAREVRLDDPTACPRYLGRVIQGVDICRKTPDWLNERLRRCGLRSINNVVDITNYIMLELGQPMHAFDNARLSGDICVRWAEKSERLILLDGQECSLSANTLVIADVSGPIAMAGIIGGNLTAVTEATTDLFLECAYFSPDAIQGRARQYGLHTDSSHRYERGVDFELQQLAMERATDLILKICGGQAGPLTHAFSGKHLPSRTAIVLRKTRLEKVLGTQIDTQMCTDILTRLECAVIDKTDRWEVTSPSFRFDINLEVDLIEEIARVHGYSNIPSSAIPAVLRIAKRASDTQFNQIKYLLVARGYHEAITYSFIDHAMQKSFADAELGIRLTNPISSEHDEMRQSLIPGLVSVLTRNINRQQNRVRIFEIGRTYTQNPELEQPRVVAGISFGNIYNKQWDGNNICSNFYNMKSDVEAILAPYVNLSSIRYAQSSLKALHPHRSAGIFLGNQHIGVMGMINPSIMQEVNITNDIYIFEINLEKIFYKFPVKYKIVSKYPAIRRDMAIVLDENTTFIDVADSIQKSASGYLENLELFDVYRGEGIDIGKKSLALGLTFQVTSSTLTDSVVEELFNKVLSALTTDFGAKLRE
jgi:phenylalanyl-tRNA synthetase beta chain